MVKRVLIVVLALGLVVVGCVSSSYAVPKYARLNIQPIVCKGDVVVISTGKDQCPEKGAVVAEVDVDQHMVEFQGVAPTALVDYYAADDSYYGWYEQEYIQMAVDVMILPGGDKQNAFVVIRALDKSSGLVLPAYRIYLNADSNRIIVLMFEYHSETGAEKVIGNWTKGYKINPYDVYRIRVLYNISAHPMANRIVIDKLSCSGRGIPSTKEVVNKSFEEMGLAPLTKSPFGFHVGTKSSAARFFNEKLHGIKNYD